MTVLTLPNKPSELIRLALNDMQKTIDTGYRIDMSQWLVTSFSDAFEEPCCACMAGSVMLQSLDAEKLGFENPSAYDPCSNHLGKKGYSTNEPLDEKLYFLNIVREFMNNTAYWRLNKVSPEARKKLSKQEYLALFDGEISSICNNNLALYARDAFGDTIDGLYDKLKNKQLTPVIAYEKDSEMFFKTVNWLADDFESLGM